MNIFFRSLLNTMLLCKVCTYYEPKTKTCKLIIQPEYSESPKKCGAKAVWFSPVFGADGLSQVVKHKQTTNY